MSFYDRIRNLVRPGRIGDRIDEELSFHITERVEELVASGLDEDEARARAHRQFGNYLLKREQTHDMDTIRWLESLWMDLRYAVRTLAGHKTFAVVALLTLSLGIGANTAIFALLDAVVLRPVPVENPDRLVVFGTNNGRGIQGREDPVDWGDRLFSYPLYEQLRDSNTVFDELAAVSSIDAGMFVRPAGAAGGTVPDPVSARLVSGNYFRTLGVAAFLGRTIAAADNETRGAHPVVVLSHGYWRRRFASDPAVVGSQLSITGQVFDVIGIAPPGFRGEAVGLSPDIYVPLMMYETAFSIWRIDNPSSQHLLLIGRLKSGVSRAMAESSMTVAFQQAIAAAAGTDMSSDRRARLESRRISLLPGQEGLSSLARDFGRPLQLLMAGVCLVLLIACANIANLLLAQAGVRAREIAVRTALGAGRHRLVRQLLTESLLLSMGAGVAALVVATVVVRVLTRTIFDDGVMPLDIGIDQRVFVFTGGLSVVTALVFGMIPAFHVTRTRLATSLKGATASVGAPRRFGLRKTLLVVQVTLSLTLLVAAGVFGASVRNLRGVDLGYRIDGLHAFQLDARSAGLSSWEPERLVTLERALLDRIRAVPGVENASLSMYRLLDPVGRWRTGIAVDGYLPDDGEQVVSEILTVSPGYFETSGIPLMRGRSILDTDGGGTNSVVVVNQAFADRYLQGRNAVGARVEILDESREVVGVTADARYGQPRQEASPKIFVPVYQVPTGLGHLQVRSTAETGAVTLAVRQVLAEINPGLVILEATNLNTQLERVLSRERLMSNLTAAFGVLGLLLAAVGLFGVMNYGVMIRTKEIGLRVALGAGRAAVLWMILREAFVLIALGTLGGLASAYAATRLADHLLADGFLYGISPADPVVIGLASLLLVSVGAAAAYLPAHRAASVDPMVSLRHD